MKKTLLKLVFALALAMPLCSSAQLMYQEQGNFDVMLPAVKSFAQQSDVQPPKKDLSGFDIDFAWGWHNWGRDMFTGFGGVESASDVGTTFNNVQLAGKWVVAKGQWVGFSVGLGLEWDRWKFYAPHVVFNTNATPYSFAIGGSTDGSSQLRTRYVTLPLSLRIGERKGVHLELSAIPGLHWNGTGLRYKHDVGGKTKTDKDRMVNKYINPYKFDLRAAVYFKSFGVYAQFSTMSVMKDNSESLIPVKFGLII